MKKCIIFTMLLCVSLFAFGQEPTSVYIQKEDGTTQTALLVAIEKITFEADMLLLKTSEGEFCLPLDDVDKITFGDTNASTAVENVNINSIRISKSDNLLSIWSGYAMKQLYLVDMSGKVLVSKRPAAVDMTSIALPGSGVFVLFLETSQGYIARKVINN